MLLFMTNWIKICLLILMITMKSCQKFYKMLKIYNYAEKKFKGVGDWGYSTQKFFFLLLSRYYLQSISRYKCTNCQLKKNKNMCNHTPPPPRQGVNGAPFVPKLYASSGRKISKCIEGGSIKFTTLVDYI